MDRDGHVMPSTEPARAPLRYPIKGGSAASSTTSLSAGLLTPHSDSLAAVAPVAYPNHGPTGECHN